jgi:putative MATE family efflux protein
VKIQISDHFNYNKLLRFTVPTIVMMMFSAAYSVIDDGFFVANFVGKEAFVALNLMAPVITVMGAVGFMLGTGGNAVVSKALGEGKKDKANQHFTLITLFTIAISAVITAFGLAVLKPACIAMGAEGAVLEDCLTYGYLIFPFTAVFLLQGIFQSFLITAGQPKLSMIITITSGISNIVFDTLLIVILKWGLVGAVWATLSGSIFGTLIPAGYFLFAKDRNLKFVKTPIEFRVLLRTCSNGSSELVTNLSIGLVSMLYNYQLMRIAGNDGVASFGAIMYIAYVFASAFMGYSMGVAPLVGYSYGAQNHAELQNIFHKSIVILCITGLILFALSELAAVPFSMIFVNSDEELLQMTVRGTRIYSLIYLVSGINIFGTGFFTALDNGAVSAALALIRTMVLEVAAVFLLPLIWGIDGIWASAFVSDLLMLGITIGTFMKMRPRYGY